VSPLFILALNRRPRLSYIDYPLIFGTFRLKKTGEQVDDRVVEVHWDPSISRWRVMRFRDDKPHGNHKSVVQNIIQSIADGVEKDAVSVPSSLPVCSGITFLYVVFSLASCTINRYSHSVESPDGPAQRSPSAISTIPAATPAPTKTQPRTVDAAASPAAAGAPGE
jgi:hypothetical protein